MENLGELVLSIHSISLALNEYKMSSLKYKIKKAYNIKYKVQSIHEICRQSTFEMRERERERQRDKYTHCTVVKLQV